MKHFNKFYISAIIVCILGLLVSCSSENKIVYRTLEEIQASGYVNIGVSSDKNPFGYVDENGEYQGFDVYFARRVAQDLGVKINFVSTEAASRIEYLQTGKVDIVISIFTYSDERAKEVDFALPYMKVSLGLVSHNDNVITSLDDFKDTDSIIVTSGTTAQVYLEANYPNIKLQKYDAFALAINSFINKNAVAWANDNTDVIAFANTNDGYTVGIPSFGNNDTINPAVSKGNESLLNWLNEEIVNLGKENFFHENYNATLLETYGAEYTEDIIIEGGIVDND